MTSLGESDNGGSATIGVGETLTIRLSESVSGGYCWSPERLDDKLLELVSIARQAVAGSIGSAAYAVVTLRGLRPGTTRLVLRQWRPWEGDSSTIDRFHIDIHVTA